MSADNTENSYPSLTLIGKYLAGEATPEEAAGLHEWMEEGENQAEFERLEKVWLLLPGTVALPTLDVQESWNKVQPGVVRQMPPVRFKAISYLAAACVAAAVLFFSFSWFRGEEPSHDGNIGSSLITKSAGNSILQDTLTDGSVATLYRESALSYPVAFGENRREVRLKGESYFNVKQDPSKPFIIIAGALKIQVVGTSFNVNTTPDDSIIEVQVREGVVKMITTDNELTVNKGQTGVYVKREGSLQLREGIDSNSFAYATGTFFFKDLSIGEAAKYLEKAFGVRFRMEDDRFSKCRITATFVNKPLDYILEVIHATLNTTSLRKENVIHFKGGGCE